MGGLVRDAGAIDAGRRASGRRGFTLLELLITLSVTTIGLVGLVSLHVSVVRGNDGASRAAEAQQITVNRLESLRAQRLGDLIQTFTGSLPPPPPAPLPPLPTPKRTWGVPGRGNMPYTVTAWVDSLPSVSPSLLKIRVETSWTEDGGTFGKNPTLDHKLALEVIRTQEDEP
jgi:prepilin-type N-terminal cleavage/methylation domain-containing protein